MELIRRPAVAGAFYPSQAEEIRAEVEEYLQTATRSALVPKALVAPHAGYIYSGPVAASAYLTLKNLKTKPTRVVLLGPSHRVPVRGLALPGCDAFATPLGQIPLDQEALEELAQLPFVEENPRAHAFEHSLEVHLPFLQIVLGDFGLVPLVVGQARPEDIAQALNLVVDDSTLLVVSTDLSHYHSYSEAQKMDRATIQSVLSGNTQAVVAERACGAFPLKGVMKFAELKHWKPELLDLRNSGDTAGDKAQVVGYAALLYH